MKARRLVVASLLVMAAYRAVVAGGPRAVNGAGQPMAWSTAGPVTYNPENGPLGQLTNAQARSLLEEAFAEWQAGPASITFTEGSLLGVDVNAVGIPLTNPAHYQDFYRKNGDGLSPVIFDTDGSIIDAIFGAGARFDILGVAGLDTPVSAVTTITEASIVINGAFFDGIGLPSSPADVSLIALKAAMVHEIGHFINLDHSVLNHELAFDGNPGNDIYVPTMFPVTVDDEDAIASTNPDDRLAAENLYPSGAPGNGFTGSVTSSGAIPIQGANVVFRKTDDPLMTAYALISGGRFFPCNPGSSCDPCSTTCNPGNPAAQGSFSAEFFAPGSYKVCVEQIDRRFTAQSGAFVGPLATPALLPGPEECFDAAESGTASDDPDDFVAVAAGSGTPIAIALNALPTSDAFEPNNNFANATVLANLPSGSDTAPAVLDAADLDVYQVPVVAGQRVRIDIDAKEFGSGLDAVIGFYNASNVLVGSVVDDAVDPDSGEFSFDPALELITTFTGTAKIKVSSYPDLDQDGVGGATTGAYWLRVEVATDTDGDGAPDAEDICPATVRDDADRDGVCFGADNCPTESNPGQDAPVKISGTMPLAGDVSFFAISGDDARVVFVADPDNDEVFELYSVPVGGAASPVKLNTNLGATLKDVTSFVISRDSARVVYLADQDTDDVFELYSVPIAGGTVTKLNGSMVTGGDVLEFNISPNSATVVYRADQITDGVGELFSVPINGGTPVKISGTMVAGGSLINPGAGFSSFLISGNSATIVYGADQDTDEKFEIYSVPIAGGAPVKLNGTFVAGGDIRNFQMDGIDGRVVYAADQEIDEVPEIYSVPLTGGTVTKLNGTLPPGATGWHRFRITADGATVTYTMDQETANVFELYAVPIAGGTRTKLSGPMVPGGNVGFFAIPTGPLDGNRLTYTADQDVDGRFELYSVPISGGTLVKLNAPLVAGGNVTAQGGGIFNSRVLYVADQTTDEQFEVYSVPAAGGTPVKVTGTMVPSGDYQGLRFDSTRIAVRADKDTDEVLELYGVRLQGGEPLKLNAPLVAGGDVTSWSFTAASNPGTVVYLADQDTDEKFELYSRIFSLDTDADGVFDRCDRCPLAADASQADTDGNGVGDACQACAVGTDLDGDGVCGAADNCPEFASVNQADFDGDGAGDVCDADDDNDGLLDVVETSTGTYGGPGNTGSNPLDADSDDDGVSDGNEVAQGTNPNSPAGALPTAPFQAGRAITTGADGPWAVEAADLDGDGDIDALSASENDDTIAWYANLDGKGTFGARQVITSTADGARAVAAADLDRDGDLDVISGSYLDGTVAWHENLNGLGTSWTAHAISTTANGASWVVAADLDGDGDLDVLSADLLADRITWHENRLNEISADFGPPQALPIAGSVSPTRVAAADIDHDGDLDVVSAWLDNTVAWHENLDGAGTFGPQQPISTASAGADSVAPADVDGDGDLDVFVASYLDHEVSWYENLDGQGSFDAVPHIIATGGSGPGAAHSVFAADIDGDGDADVLVASYGDDKVGWYENLNGAGTFGPRHVLTATAAYALYALAADIDGDGDIDAVSASFGDDTIQWFENETIHRNAAFPVHNLISAAVAGPVSVDAGDIDGDGDIDTLHADGQADTIRWFASDGASPPAWTMHTVGSTPAGLEYAELKDLDRDGDLDVLLASGGVGDTVAWYESGGGAVPSWTYHVISTTQDGPLYVTAADLDGDGDLDVVASSFGDRKVSWYRNDGASPPGFTEFVVSTSGVNAWRRGLALADMDHDGDIDIVAAVPNLGVHWYQNDGASTPGWTERVISDAFGLTSYIDVADVNGDGDLDVVATEYTGSRIGWFENDGAAVPSWTTRAVVMADNQWSMVSAKDMDRDGDVDIVATSGAKGFVWLDNDGNDPPAWTIRTISGVGVSVGAMTPADVDADGDVDLVIGVISQGTGHQHEWWENRGGQFTLATTSLTPATIGNGATQPVLAVDFTSNARPGDPDVELATLELRVTDGGGVSLSSEAANRLIERVRVYRDNGSSVFEPGSDTLVATVEDLTLAPLVIPFAKGDPRVRLAPGQSKRLFVVVETTLDASLQSPHAFKITHATQAGSKARDAVSGALLSMQYAADVATPTMTAVGDLTPPFVTSVFPESGSVDVTANTDVLVFMSEPVDPATASAGVSLASGGAKIAGAVRVSIDGRTVTYDPIAPLTLGGNFQLKITSALKDRSGNGATPFTSTFEATSSAGSGTIDAGALGAASGGSLLEGANADDNSGFSAAALGDVNATTASQGISDLIVGAPNADNGAVDAGEARLVFGAPGLQSSTGAFIGVKYRTGVAGDFVGETVAPAGDMNHDGIKDFLIGAPRSDQSFSDAGVVYLVFGDPGIDELTPGPLDLNALAACASPTLCGVKFLGAGSGDKAGLALSRAGDVNADGTDDILIGAPGADPAGRADAGVVYLIFGPLAPGTIALSSVGTTTPGLVLRGETAGDHLGTSVSQWEDRNSDGIDDMLLGAPDATPLDEFGVPIAAAGYVYAVQGGRGPGHLVDAATPGIIELSRVASGAADQVAGMVFLGASPNGALGRSLTGGVDTDGNGIDDILIAGNGEVFAIPGDGPKTVLGGTRTGGTSASTSTTLSRPFGGLDAIQDFGAARYVAADSDPLTIGPAGDLNRDGFDDFIVGAPLADGAAGTDSGRAYVVLGSPASSQAERQLADIGGSIAGFVVEGAEAGDNLGASVGGGQDVNADGVDDGLVGAPFADTGAGTPANAGATYVISPLHPDEVAQLLIQKLGGTTVRLEWSVPDLAAGYNVYRGLLSVVRSGGGVRTSAMTSPACGTNADADADQLPDYDDADAPPGAGDAFVYLVTARNVRGEGPLGAGTPTRSNDAQCP